jgi:hypothetical protein
MRDRADLIAEQFASDTTRRRGAIDWQRGFVVGALLTWGVVMVGVLIGLMLR